MISSLVFYTQLHKNKVIAQLYDNPCLTYEIEITYYLMQSYKDSAFGTCHKFITLSYYMKTTVAMSKIRLRPIISAYSTQPLQVIMFIIFILFT